MISMSALAIMHSLSETERFRRSKSQVLLRQLLECPRCGTSTKKVHGRYVRHLADLPYQIRSDTTRHHNPFR
jgi:hypothetical protein